jgi:outer membrane protein assembly factor BamD
MRFGVRCILTGAILCFAYGCGPKSAKLQKSVVPPDKALFETGSNFLKRGDYIKSRLAFQNLITTYPESELTADAYFSMGDSFYEEGGTENYIQAEEEYKNFIIFFQAHPRSADAQLKIISLNMKMMRAPDRDQQYTYKALRAIDTFLQRFPDSDFVPSVKGLKSKVEENLALSDLGVGEQYAVKGNLKGAQGRYQNIVDEYKEFSALDEVYFRLGSIWQKVYVAQKGVKGNTEEAVKAIKEATDKAAEEAALNYAKIAKGYPFSKHYEEAQVQLKMLGKSVPSVDTQLAALNQSRIKPEEGFSPMKPLIDFGKALGFVGTPDIYKETYKTVEAAKIQNANAQLAAAKAGEDGQPGDDIQIERTIVKTGEGETQDAQSVGTNPSESSQSGSEKKKVSNRYKRKNTKKPL